MRGIGPAPADAAGFLIPAPPSDRGPGCLAQLVHRRPLLDEVVCTTLDRGRPHPVGGEIAGEAGDGCTAITKYDRTTPDMVLMDITMPQMEGIEAAERIVRAHPNARIVMVAPGAMCAAAATGLLMTTSLALATSRPLRMTRCPAAAASSANSAPVLPALTT